MWKWFVLPGFYLFYWGICFLATGGDKRISPGCVAIRKKSKLWWGKNFLMKLPRSSLCWWLCLAIFYFSPLFSFFLACYFVSLRRLKTIFPASFISFAWVRASAFSIFWLSICFGGEKPNASASLFCRTGVYIKTRESISIPFLGESLCSRPSLWLRRFLISFDDLFY